MPLFGGRGVSILLGFSIVFLVFLIGSAVFWEVESRRLSLEDERMKSVRLEADRSRESLRVTLSAVSDHSCTVNVTNSWSGESIVKFILALNGGNVVGISVANQPILPGETRSFSLSVKSNPEAALVLTELGNSFIDEPSRVEGASSGGAESSVFGSNSSSILEPSEGLAVDLASSRIQTFNITSYYEFEVPVDFDLYTYGWGRSSLSLDTYGTAYARAGAQEDSQSGEAHGAVNNVVDVSTATLSDSKTVNLGVATLTLQAYKAYAKAHVTPVDSNTYAEGYLSFTITFPSSKPRVIIYREPYVEVRAYYVDASGNTRYEWGTYDVSSPGTTLIGDDASVRGNRYRRWRYVVTSSRSISGHWGGYKGIGVNQYYLTPIKSWVDVHFENSRLRLIVIEYESASCNVTDINLDIGTYYVKRVNGTMYPYTLGFTDYAEYPSFSSATLILRSQYSGLMYFKPQVDSSSYLGGYELISIGAVAGYTESGEKVFRTIGEVSWAVLPDLVLNGSLQRGVSPFEVYNTRNQLMSGVVFTEPVKSGNTYTFFAVKNNLPYNPLDVTVRVDVYTNRHTYWLWTTRVNPGETKNITYTYSGAVTFDPTYEYVYFTPVVLDEMNLCQVAHHYLYNQTWQLTLT